MEESHSLLLNEEALKACPDAKKAVFVYEWLRYLDRILPTIQKADLRSMQGKLIAQLETRLAAGGGPPTRQLIASCIAKVFAVGDSSALFTIINQCNDSLKAKDESAHQLHIKLTAVCCLGALYENVGRLVGRSYEETFQLCTKWFKTAESQGRTEMMCMLTRMARGLGNGGQSVHKEMHKLARTAATDRAMPVRVAALQCLAALVKEYPPLYTTELEATITLCVKSLEGSSYEARRAVAGLISALLSAAHTPPQQVHHSKPGAAPIPIRALPVDECLQLLANAFLRGGIGGFLKGATSSGAAAAGGSREVRVGITMGYVAWISSEGVLWLERNVSVVCSHLCQLASKTGVLGYTNVPAQQQEVILLRQCISYIFRSSIGRILGEGAQLSACKALGGILAEAINAFDYSLEPSSERELGPDVHACGQLVAVAVLEMSALVRQIGTAVTPLFVEASGIMEPVFACLLHPLLPARAATAWCLRCVAFAVPSQLTPLIDRCLSRLEHMRGSADAVSGYSLALSALIAGSADCRLGIPHAKPRQVLCVAEELLRTAAQSPRVAVAKMNAGWLLLHALAQLGPSVTREMLPKVLLLWRAAFPRSAKEAEAEKNRGDAFTWQCALESRAGALAVMCAVCTQAEMQTEEVIKAVLLPAECSLVAMSQVGALIRSFGSPIRRLIAMVRVRVYALLALLPPKTYESVYASLLRELVADVTLSDNSQSTQSTTLASSMCRGPERTLAEPWADECDERVLEAQMCALLPGGTAAALENDTTCLVTGCTACLDSCWPQPLQPPAQCVDAAVVLYGRVFPLVPAKHKLQITDHFAEVIKNNAKNVQRQHAIQLNSVCAVAHALKAIGEQKSLRLDGEALHKSTSSLIVLALMSPLPMTRCVAAEALGRLAHAAADPQFVVALAATAFERLKSAREVPARQGWALSLGCLHRHCGSLGSGQHLNTAVSLVLALAQDPSAPAVQAWSLVALAQMAETGGGQFRAYVEPVLAVCLRLLLTTGSGGVEVVQCAGKVLSALMTCVGPELAAGGAGAQAGIRQGLLAACALQMAHPDALVVCEALAGLQQMHLFAPRHVQMDALVAWIAGAMSSPHVCLRRAAVSCLRQLSQREAREVREHAEALVPHGVVEESKCLPLPDTGLEGALFAMLDVETEPTLIAHIQETLISLVQATCGDLLAVWLALCKEILAASSGENARSTLIVDDKGRKAEEGEGEEDEEDGGDDDCTLRGVMSGKVDKGKPSPRWETRVFAAQLVRRLMQVCDTERAHLDLALAKELQMSSGGRADYLVLHLSDLVRMSFMAATSDNTELRLEGLKSLQDVITRFSAVPEPEFPGHVILEQFQAQVGAALRPAFAEETPSHVTAAACQVCSTWIGSGVARDLNDLRRVHQLLVSSLSKLRHGSINTQLYSESAATLEQLSILKAWAEVYATAVQQQEAAEKEKAVGGGERSEDDGLLAGGGGGGGDTLLALVKPELHSLAAYWLAALRDAALLALPGEFEGQLPKKGAFWQGESVETCRGYFRGAWPSMLLAAAIWLQHNSFQLPDEREGEPSPWPTNSRESRLRVLIGLAVEALSARSGYSDDLTIQTCVRALCRLLATDWCAVQLMREPAVAIEIVHVLHRLILTRDSLLTQQLCSECAGGVLAAAVGAVELGGQRGDMENGNACIGSEQIDQNTIEQLYRGEENVMCAEGGEPRPQPGSLSFALLELHLCLLVRQMPQINSSSMRRQLAPLHLRRLGRLPPESANLVRSAVAQLVQLPKLCSPDGAVRILPVLLYLLMGLLRESARVDELQQQQPPLPAGHLSPTATAALQALRQLCSSVPSDKTHQLWVQHLRNAMHTLLQLPAAEPPVDACVVQLACVVMAAAAPAAVSLSHRPTQRALAHLVKRGLASGEKTVVSKTLQSVTSLFSRRDICAPFVKELAPCVFDVLRPLVSGEEAPERAKHVSLEEVQVVADAIRAMEAVIAQAKEEKKRLSLVSLLAQSVCRLLLAFDAEQWRLLSPAARKLHETALARLNALAPAYPAEFRLVVSCHPELKRRVEAALLFQSTRQQTTLNANKLKQSRETAKPTTAQPTIKLTMDFNAFGKAAE